MAECEQWELGFPVEISNYKAMRVIVEYYLYVNYKILGNSTDM